MASCDICGKKWTSGNNVSHANNRTKRSVLPNVQRKRLVVGGNSRRVNVCTRCLRSGAHQKTAV